MAHHESLPLETIHTQQHDILGTNVSTKGECGHRWLGSTPFITLSGSRPRKPPCKHTAPGLTCNIFKPFIHTPELDTCAAERWWEA